MAYVNIGRNVLPTAPRIPSLGVDALYAVRGQPGAASDYYKFSTDPNSPYNIFGNRYLGKLQADWAKGITSGGNKQVHKILTGLGTSKTGSKQGFVKRNPNVGKLFAQYFRTGVVPRGLTPDLAKHAYDYALRATGRDAVMDRQGSFFGNLVKGNLGALAGTAAGFALGGPIGAKWGGTLGGGIQGATSGGLKGAALGGLTGYGVGSLGGWAGGKLAPNFTGFAMGPGQAAAPIVTRTIPAAANPNAVPGAAGWRPPVPGQSLAGGLTKAQGAGRTVAAGAGVPKTWANMGGAATAANLPNSLNEFVGLGAAGNKPSNFLTNLISKAKNMDVGTGLSNLASAANILGVAQLTNTLANPIRPAFKGLSTDIANLYGDILPSDEQSIAEDALGLTTRQGRNVMSQFGDTGQMVFDNYGQLIEDAALAARDVDTQGLSRQFYDQYNSLMRQEADDLRRLESVLFNTRGIHKGTEDRVRDFKEGIENAREDRAIKSVLGARNYQGVLQDQFRNLAGGLVNFNTGVFNPLRTTGLESDRLTAQLGLNSALALSQAQSAEAVGNYMAEQDRRNQLNSALEDNITRDALQFGLDFLGIG